MITSSTNKQIKWVRSLQAKRRARQADLQFVIEGTRMVEEALRSDRVPHLVLYTPTWGADHPELLDQLKLRTVRLDAVEERVLGSCSDVEKPQGVLAVMPIEDAQPKTTVDLVLILDRLSDPGNLGTILRTAVAAQVDQVFLTPGTVDAYNPKVVRAGMGAHFKLTLQEGSLDQLFESVSALSLWVAEARQGLAYHQVDWSGPIALVIGSETHGVHADIRARAHGQVHIPIAKQSESLNAGTAAAVILFEIQRQRGS